MILSTASVEPPANKESFTASPLPYPRKVPRLYTRSHSLPEGSQAPSSEITDAYASWNHSESNMGKK